MKLPKSYIKKYGGITKAAWAAFRRDKGKRKSGSPSRKKTTTKGAGRAKAMARRTKRRVKTVARKGYRRARQALSTKPGKVVTMALTATAGAVGTSLVVNKTPVLRDQARVTKSILQGGVGMLAIFFVRNRHIKALGAGAVVAGVMGVAKEMLKVEPLAGPGGRGTLSPTEMQRLINGQRMGMPLPGGQSERMGVPMSAAPANAGFGSRGFGNR